MSIIEQIKAEVERLKGDYRITNPYDKRAIRVCEKLLSFLSTLQEQPVKTDIVEDLKHYLATTPKEKQIKDWEELKEWGKVNPSVSEFLGWEQPVCVDLEEAAKEYSKKVSSGHHYADIICSFIDGATWQKEQMEERWLKDRDGCFWDGVEEGKKAMREQMLKEAVERIVKEDAGGYPYIDATELYDYTEDKPLAKKGDKVRIVIVKED